MEGNEDNYYYDYVKLDTFRVDETTGKRYYSPLIIKLTDEIHSVYVSHISKAYASIVISDPEFDYEFEVDVNMVDETFDKIYKVLRELSSESETDDSHNDID